MLHYTNEQLATIIAIPIIIILLIWTVTIFQKNRKKWSPYDIPIVAVLVLSTLRNITILSYTLLIIFYRDFFNFEYCSIITWLFNSIHTFQASSLTTIAVIGLFSVKLYCKEQSLKQFLTTTHVVYHLFCLTTLCACVGVAAILAQNENSPLLESATMFYISPCKFMPFELDIKFNVFIIVLHVFLSVVSFFCFISICFKYALARKQDGFDYLKKSNSDLSDLSLANTFNNNENKNFYDTYTIPRMTAAIGNLDGNGNFFDNGITNYHHHQNYKDVMWNSDVTSNMSTTVSSTNSRRPCLAKPLQEDEDDENRTGLETMHPVLIVCYLFYHIPLIVLCIYPKFIAPWSVAGAALWLGLIQDLLIPIGLGIVDSRFSRWVSNVYSCTGKNVEEKLPQVGLDGKFRPFGSTSQPQSLEILHQAQDRNHRGFHSIEHRFPLTNGSLYTSIDGRLPVIHNYRRHKEQRAGRLDNYSSSNLVLHSSHLKRQESTHCKNCEIDSCPSHSNLHHLSPHYINKQLQIYQQQNDELIATNKLLKRLSLSQDGVNQFGENRHLYWRPDFNQQMTKNLNSMQCKNYKKLNEQSKDLCNRAVSKEIVQQESKTLDYSSSSEEDYSSIHFDQRNDDSLSSKSCYSITTEANCDFDFYQNKNNVSSIFIPHSTPTINKDKQNDDYFQIRNIDQPMTTFKPQQSNNFGRNRISRSNSKRSLENFQSFIEEDVNVISKNNVKLQRSNSYMTLEDRKKRNNVKLLRSSSKLSDCTHNIRQKIKSVEYLPKSNASTVYIEDVCYLNVNNFNSINTCGAHKVNQRYVGSVPDLKKVFISEYI